MSPRRREGLPAVPARLLVVDRAGEAIARWLGEHGPAGLEVRAVAPDAVTPDDVAFAEAFVGMRPPFCVEGSPVRWVHAAGAGVDAFLADLPSGVLLTRTVGRMGERIGEYCVARVLAVCQRIVPLLEDQRARRWDRVEARTLRGTTALVVGTGAIGTGIARAFVAAGVRVLGVSRGGGAGAPFEEGIPVSRLAGEVARADWIVLAAPATGATRRLLDEEVLSRARGAWLVNVARGSLVDEEAMLAALRDGRLAGAWLDVFETEPLPAESPLWDPPNVHVSPHVAALTHPGETGEAFVECYEDLQAGRRPRWAVDAARGY